MITQGARVLLLRYDDTDWTQPVNILTVKDEGQVDDKTARDARECLRSTDCAGDIFALGFVVVEVPSAASVQLILTHLTSADFH